MEGINILATTSTLNYGVGSLWVLIIGILVLCFGVIGLIMGESEGWAIIIAIGAIVVISTLCWIFTPVEAHIATIENNVPYKYIEEHYVIKDKEDNLYTLIPLEEEK